MKVLLATDGSEQVEQAIRLAVELTGRTDSELHVVYVGPLATATAMDSRAARARMEENVNDRLEHEVERVRAAGGTVSKAHHRRGDAADGIVRLSEELEAGMIVVGSRKLGGLRRAFEGSVSDKIVHSANCPVLVVHSDRRNTR